MTTSSPQFDNHERELHDADQMNAALDAMKEGSSPKIFSADPAFQTLVRLHTQTSDHEVDDEFADDIEQLILSRCARDRSEEHVRGSFWRTWTMPLVSLAVVAGVVVGISSDVIPLNVRGLQERFFTPRTNTNIVSPPEGNSNINAGDTIAPTPTTTAPKPLPSVTDLPGLAAAGVENDMAEIELVKKEVENTMREMEEFAVEVDALNDANDVEALLDDFESINL